MSDLANINLNLELGPVFLAHCFNWSLYGLLCLQIYMFYASFPRDALHTKALVYGLFIIDTISIALATYSGYWIFVKNWGQNSVFTDLGWSWATIPASSGLVAFIVQTFFAYRIWIISKNWFMSLFIIILSGVACGFSFATAMEIGRLQTFTYARNRTPTIWISFAIAADFFVCVTLVYYFLKVPTGFKVTNRIVIRLVRIAIETALVTIVAAVVKLFLIFTKSDNMHLLICLLLARLYSNALLGALNSRSHIFGGTHVTEESPSKRRVWSIGPGSSIGSVKKEAFRKTPEGKIMVTEDYVSDCELGIHDADDKDGQVISYESRLFAYPLSPMAPSYFIQRPEQTKTPTSWTNEPLIELPSAPPSAKALPSDRN